MASESEMEMMPLVVPAKVNRSCESKSFKCSFPGCNLLYSRQWKLDRHYYTHTGERPFLCDTPGCKKAYQCNTHLQRHIRMSHCKTEVVLACTYPTCKATFRYKSALLKHSEVHGKPRPYQCSVCSVSFLKKQRLIQHEMAHNGILPFTCAVCQAAWASQTLLRRHMRSHAMLQCEYPGCSEICTSRPLMRRHAKLQHHTVLTCEQCNKSFNNKGILREHVLIHLPADDRGVFQCPNAPCKRAYFQMRNLRHHIKIFHKNKRYYCTVKNCSSSYFTEVCLNRHILKKHKPKEERKNKFIGKLTSITPIIDEEVSDAVTADAEYNPC